MQIRWLELLSIEPSGKIERKTATCYLIGHPKTISLFRVEHFAYNIKCAPLHFFLSVLPKAHKRLRYKTPTIRAAATNTMLTTKMTGIICDLKPYKTVGILPAKSSNSTASLEKFLTMLLLLLPSSIRVEFLLFSFIIVEVDDVEAFCLIGVSLVRLVVNVVDVFNVVLVTGAVVNSTFSSTLSTTLFVGHTGNC
uniref:Uncharacterized protein n=1 Tax=Glossina palpalis gambiensis TaxID=67801 RepID=A0A1B0BB27_9MUSC